MLEREKRLAESKFNELNKERAIDIEELFEIMSTQSKE